MGANKVVLVPGMFSLGSVFYELKKELENKGKTVRVVDFPMKITPDGYVYSGPCETDFWDKLNFLLRILKDIEGSYDLVGHSAGALLALRAAEDENVNPGRLILIAPAPPKGLFALYPSVIRSFFFVLRTPFFHAKSFWISYDQFRWAMANTLTEERALKIYRRLRPESGKFIYQIGLAWLDPTDAAKVNFRKIHCPIDIVVGSEDRVTPVGVSLGIRQMGMFFRSEQEWKKYPVHCMEIGGYCHWKILDDFKNVVVGCVAQGDSIDKGENS